MKIHRDFAIVWFSITGARPEGLEPSTSGSADFKTFTSKVLSKLLSHSSDLESPKIVMRDYSPSIKETSNRYFEIQALQVRSRLLPRYLGNGFAARWERKAWLIGMLMHFAVECLRAFWQDIIQTTRLSNLG